MRVEDLSARNTNRRLESAGFALSGRGHFGEVWVSGDKAVKITRDRCWDRFVDMCRTEENKHFPKIFSSKKLGGGKSATVMERLYPVPADFWRTERGEEIADFIKTNHLNRMMDHHKLVAMFTGGKIKSFTGGDSFLEALVKLSSKFGRTGCYMDMHPQNIMQRADGVLVVSDPVRPPVSMR